MSWWTVYAAYIVNAHLPVHEVIFLQNKKMLICIRASYISIQP